MIRFIIKCDNKVFDCHSVTFKTIDVELPELESLLSDYSASEIVGHHVNTLVGAEVIPSGEVKLDVKTKDAERNDDLLTIF